MKEITAVVAEPKYSHFLINHVLAKKMGLFCYNSDPIQSKLLEIGALKRGRENEMVSSPLIRSILMRNVVSTNKYTFESIPVADGLLNVKVCYNIITYYLKLIIIVQEYSPI